MSRYRKGLTLTDKKILIRDIQNIKNNHSQKNFITNMLSMLKQTMIDMEAYEACADLKAIEDRYGIDIPFDLPSSQ